MAVPKTARALLTTAEMAAADKIAIASGVPGATLMENAGAAIERAIRRRWAPRPTVVLCGPGNNGGDGFVVARRLAARRWPVTVAAFGAVDDYRGDAALMARRWVGPVHPLAPDVLDGQVLVVDALFGAGLARPVDGPARSVLEAAGARGLEIVAVDIPSGVHGDTGAVTGIAPQAALTVTFFRPKPGHILMPGRSLCGSLEVADIGIPAVVLDEIAPKTRLNTPDAWVTNLPQDVENTHKYRNGHVLVMGGRRASTGAARLVARAALRSGAGLVTVAAPEGALDIYAGSLTAVMTRPVASTVTADDAAFGVLLADERLNVVVIGPGGGVDDTTRARTLAAIQSKKAVVIDADALSSFGSNRDQLFDYIQKYGNENIVLTPHDGEYARLFDEPGDRLVRSRAAARISGATVLLKGADTVVSAPDGTATIAANAPPTLATAGSGDVLAGLIAAQMARGATAYDAAASAAWMHGAAANRIGTPLIAEDLPEAMPAVLAGLRRVH